MSDHSLIIINRKMKINQSEEMKVETRKFKEIDYELINSNIINNEMYERLLHEEEPNFLTDNLVRIINEELDYQAPLKKITIKEKSDKKYTQETIELIEEKNKLYREYMENKNVENKVNLKNMNNTVKREKNKEDFLNKKKKFDNILNDPKKAWGEAKKQMYGNDNQITDRIIENQEIKIRSRNVANALNRFYVTKVRKIKENMKKEYKDPMESYCKFVKSPTEKLKIKVINMSDLRKIYTKLNKSNSVSNDGISMKTLVKIKNSTQPIILNIVNSVIKSVKFPKSLKITRIIPIKKGGNLNLLEPGSYRPVNLLSPISKIIEKVWALQINKFLIEKESIDSNHQGSIKGRSGSIIVSELFQKLNIAKKNKMSAALITLDQSAAYDVIPHNILKKKLIHIGIEKNSVDMIMEYLFERKQYVQVNTVKSDVLLTGNQSVGQGSVLAGLLYMIYIMDMHYQTHKKKHLSNSEYNNCKNIFINTYVDDCFGIVLTRNRDLWERIDKYIKIMNMYYINNRLQINVIKTKVMIITDIREEIEDYITIDGNKIEHVKSIKVLGTTFNEKLNWNDHLNIGKDSLVSQMKKRLNSLRMIAKNVSSKFAKQLANSLIMSKLNYHIEIWGKTNKENKNKLDKIILDAVK